MMEETKRERQNTGDLLEGLGELPEVDPSLYDIDQILAEFGGGAAAEEAVPAAEAAPPTEAAEPSAEEAAPPAPPEIPAEPEPPEEGEEEPLLSMEDIVTGTVSAVLEEQEERRQELTRRLKRQQRRSDSVYRTRTKARPEPREAAPFQEEEPDLGETGRRMKVRRHRLHRLAAAASLLTLVHWALYLAQAYGLAIPYYAELPALRLGLSALLQGAVLACGWPLFVRAARGLGQLRADWALPAVLSALAALADTLTAPLLAERCAGQSLGGAAMAAVAVALWGASYEAAALWETFRIAALGQPGYVVDTGPDGAVKAAGSIRSFYHRTVSESCAARWQGLLLPVTLTGALVFAVLCSVGQGRPQDFLWSLSAILCAGAALGLPLAYGLPFFRLARRLGKSGGAVAGSYGAEQLSRCREMLLGDGDLFPPGSVRLLGKKILCDDRRKAAACAGSLAEELGACYAPLLRTFMQEEGARPQPLVHFHIHEDGGASASIHGETAILGSAATLRKQGVRLPRAMEQKEGLYLAIDGELAAVFSLAYEAKEGVEWALHAMRRNGITPLLALRDSALSPKFLKQKFGSDGGAILLDAAARSSLAQPGRTMVPRPNGILYREGLAPFFEVVAGGKRLAQTERLCTLISLLGAVVGTLLGYYLAFSGAVTLLTPVLLLVFLLLWLAPVLLLGWSVDRI